MTWLEDDVRAGFPSGVKVTECVGLGGILFVVLVAGVVYAQEDCPTEEACKLWEEFQEKYGSGWTVSWDPYTDVPTALHGFYHLDENVTSKGEAKNIADSFLEDNRALFKIDFEELTFNVVREDQDLYDVRYRQDYRGIPVEGGRIRVTIGKKNMITGVGNNFYPNISISTVPTITEDEAVAIAKTLYVPSGLKSMTERYNSLIIIPLETDDGYDYRLAWKIPFLETTYIVDAQDGTVLRTWANMVADAGGERFKETDDLSPTIQEETSPPEDSFKAAEIPESRAQQAVSPSNWPFVLAGVIVVYVLVVLITKRRRG